MTKILYILLLSIMIFCAVLGVISIVLNIIDYIMSHRLKKLGKKIAKKKLLLPSYKAIYTSKGAPFPKEGIKVKLPEDNLVD